MYGAWRMNKHVELLAIRIRLTSLYTRSLRLDLHLAATDERDRWIEDQPVACLDAAIDFDLCAKIALYSHLAYLRPAVAEYGYLHSIAVENERIGRHHEARRLARDLELDRAVDSGSQSAIGVRDVDFRQQRPRARLQRVGCNWVTILLMSVDTLPRSRPCTLCCGHHLPLQRIVSPPAEQKAGRKQRKSAKREQTPKPLAETIRLAMVLALEQQANQDRGQRRTPAWRTPPQGQAA
jgi:hypothetical protein